MLKLKKLQILGFKSFCDRTELKFHGEGIAAIVGPNGCGKSNISDAISWVLGEQSAKTLRGTRMEDVIFAGTPARKPTGMAEVSLTLIDPDMYEGGDLSAEPEIEICDELPEEDWDEASVRAAADADTERAIEEVRPLPPEKVSAPGDDNAGEGARATSPSGESAVLDGAPSTPEAEQLPAGIASCVSTEPKNSSAPAEAAASSAENPGHVVLKIRRCKFKPMPLQKGEIILTRRLFRSGESEYLLNHKLCRLRDIQDICMGTGLGPESYAIIEQGRIGQILSSKPTDRRAIIEEAAGITKFKTRKRLSEARLEDSKQNLARVNDIFEEVTRQMNSLKRQASKAARYAKLRDEMRARLRLVLASKFAQLESETAAQHAELDTLAAGVRLMGDGVRRMEAEHGEGTQRGYAIETASRENRERLNAIALETDRATARQRQNEERCLELDQRSAAADAELAQISSKLETLETERAANRQVLESAEGDVASAQQELSARQQEAQAATLSLSSLEHQQELRRAAIMEAANQGSLVRNRITQADEHAAGLGREAQRLTNEITASSLQLESFGGERGQLTLEFDSASQRVASLATQIGELRQQLEAKRSGEGESKRRLDGLRAEYATALGKKSSLEAVIAEHGYSTDSVRRLFQSGALQNGFAPVGVLADFLEVEDRYEHVVEDFLRDELNYVVVKSWDAASEGLRLLRTDVDGRATFLVHPQDSQAKFSFVVDESLHHAPRPAPVVPLKNCIRVLNGFGKSLEVILPKLRDGYIVPDPAVGRELALENPDAFFLSQSGECFHNVTVTGGKQPAEGPLSMKRELRDVLRQMTDVEHTLGAEEARVQTLSREIAEITSLLDRLEEEKREGEKLAMTSGHTLHQLDTEMARVRERLSTYERELQRVDAERTWKHDFIVAEREELAGIEQGRTELEQAMTAAQADLGALRQARDTAAQNASEVLARVAALEERRRAAAAALDRIESLVTEVAGRVNALRTQIESAAAEKEQRGAENLRLTDQLASLAAERDTAQARDLELQAESEQVRARLVELEEQLRAARQELDLARDRRGEVAAAMAKLESDAAHMADTCLQELGVTRDDLRADTALVLVEGEQLAAEDAAYREVRARIEAMGPVNMMALDEYNEVAQRHAFLETQRKDLLDAIENLQSTIREIETVSREKFNEAFEKINQNFQTSFRKLFGGGHAFMRLTDAENSMESGIDVVASPPGKKLQNVLLLSGGEKALTALALLVGIFQYQPSPFCILDEVDAPLDDANIGRFNELVREMSVQTQFVLITHSKKTMSIAPVMYGVTMQEPGVSKLVSVRFESAAVN